MVVGPGAVKQQAVKLNETGVREAASLIFRADAQRAFSSEGVECLERLLNGVREFFRAVPPDGLPTVFIFVCPLAGRAKVGDDPDWFATSRGYNDLLGFRQRIEAAGIFVVGVRADGRYDLATPQTLPPLESWSQQSIVFVNEEAAERFIIDGLTKPMPSLVTGARSNFAVATVIDLEEALERYRPVAANVTCPILEKAWAGGRGGPRLVFRNRPESMMRNSLRWFLQTSMSGDVSVRAEHNTDETKPVDIVVNWFGANTRALIEIKWLGKSLTRDSDRTQFTTYSEARAHEGANQLTDYLSREKSSDPYVSLRGFLAVFDGRRRNVIDPETAITAADACYYRDKDVNFEPRHASGQTGISALIRYFLEPREAAFAPPTQSP